MKVNINDPKTEADYTYLCMLLWRDIWKNNYTLKSHSKYFIKYFIEDMSGDCPRCEFHDINDIGCDKCILSNGTRSCDIFYQWLYERAIEEKKQYAYQIYSICLDRFNVLRGKES